MVMTLRDATADACGGKAAALAVLLREGLPVPDGFVVPFAAHRIARDDARLPVPHALRDALAQHLALLGDPPVAVRSSAANEDTAGGSAAGQYESVLAVRGVPAVAEAIRVCWASSSSARVAEYRRRPEGDAADGDQDMAVIVQRLVDADVSGVMFTPAQPGDGTRIEASWGLGLGVVGGTVTPDAYEVASDGGIRRTIARKTTRLDRDGLGVAVRDVPAEQQERPALDDAVAATLAILGRRIAALFERPQDVEWAIADGKVWILQARPITAAVPLRPLQAPAAGAASLIGTPGAHGTVTGIARVLHGPSDFPRVQPGDVAICPCTDPAWTPLFRIAAAVVTETGGVLSHAAIVAREHGIPAVLGVPHATVRIQDGIRITVNGTEGTVMPAHG
ncbi:PEP/pyruvate-binding domain-containing protein [Microbacterium sp. No. 7]|uniref:PEP/pyruvate-binding domain-containing protein n=1 Tax=Microbacterium sp. No. 7 TaxID=1714373 RepID=UPI0006D02460|nr:PEP/pyruvate-binding domain-containing protein [Microbacterium sp. No. 7]ALJ19605.1 pyruvate phosphate dikinase [Microbacterium sp. No. 7]